MDDGKNKVVADRYKDNAVKVTVPHAGTHAKIVPEGVAPGQRSVADLSNCSQPEEIPATEAPPCRVVQLVLLAVITFTWYFGFGLFWGPLPGFMNLYTCIANNVSSCSPGGSALGGNASAEESLALDQASKDFGLFWIFVGLGNFCTVNLFGELSDVVGRKFAIIVPSLGCLATYAITCLWPVHSPLSVEFWVAITLVNLLGGQFAATGAFFASGNDLTEGLPPSERTKWQSILLGGCNIGIMMGSLVGGIVLDASGDFITLPFILGIGFTCVALVVVLVMPEPQAKSSKRKCTVEGGHPFGGIYLLLGPRGTRNTRILLVGFTFLFFGTVGVIIVAPVVFFRSLQWPATVVAYWQAAFWMAQAIGNIGLLPQLQKLRVAPSPGKDGQTDAADDDPAKRPLVFTRKVLITIAGCTGIASALALALIYVPGVAQDSGVGVIAYVMITSILFNLCQGFYDSTTKAAIADEMSVSNGGLAMSGLISVTTLAQMGTGYFFQFVHTSVGTHLGEEFGFLTFLLAATFNAIALVVFCFANPDPDNNDNDGGDDGGGGKGD